MLNKEVCKRCINETREYPNIKKRMYEKIYWTEEDETMWENGNLMCALRRNDMVILSISGNPPVGCKYALEIGMLTASFDEECLDVSDFDIVEFLNEKLKTK